MVLRLKLQATLLLDHLADSVPIWTRLTWAMGTISNRHLLTPLVKLCRVELKRLRLVVSNHNHRLPFSRCLLIRLWIQFFKCSIKCCKAWWSWIKTKICRAKTLIRSCWWCNSSSICLLRWWWRPRSKIRKVKVRQTFLYQHTMGDGVKIMPETIQGLLGLLDKTLCQLNQLSCSLKIK